MQSGQETPVKIENNTCDSNETHQQQPTHPTSAPPTIHQQPIPAPQEQCISQFLQLDQLDCKLLEEEDQSSSIFTAFPKFSEIQSSIEVLKKYFPKTIEDDFVDQIYQAAVIQHNKQKTASIRQPVFRITQESKRPFYNFEEDFNDIHFQQPYSEVSSQQNSAQHFSQQAQPNGNNMLRIIAAKSFCSHQMNYDFFKEEIVKAGYTAQITNKQYLSLLEAIFKEAHTYLERKIFDLYNMKTTRLNKDQVALLVSIYSKCTVSFTKEICQILYELIKNQMGLSSRSLSENQIKKLYKASVRAVKDTETYLQLQQFTQDNAELQSIQGSFNNLRQMQRPMDIRTKKAKLHGKDYLVDSRKKKVVHELDKNWNDKLENELIYLYKNNFQFSYIRDFFKRCNQKQQDIFTVVAVRSKLFKILRAAIRKLYYFIGNFGPSTPELITLDDQRIKTLLYTQTAHNQRVLLLQVYTSKEYNEKVVRTAINSINQYFNKLQCNAPPKIKVPLMLEDYRSIKSKLSSGQFKPKYCYRGRTSKHYNKKRKIQIK